jgi:ABC-type transport system substrate-binding protein
MRRRAFVASGLASAGIAVAPVAGRRVLRLAAVPFGHDIDPYRDAEPGVDELAWLYADGLIGWGGGPIPLLASSFPDRSADGTTYRYRLREAMWHDGRRLHARDVVDAFAAVRATDWGRREPYAHVSEVRADGELDVVVRLRAAYPGFTGSFFAPFGSPALPLIRHDGGPTPIGTGPFAVRRRFGGERWSLERWSGSPRGAARLDGIEVTLLGTSLTANVQMLSGETDVALPLPPNTVGANRFTRFRRVTSTAVLLINAEGLLRTVSLRRAFAAVANVPALQHAYDHERSSLLASLQLEGADDGALADALMFRPQLAGVLNGLTRERELVLAYVAGSPSHERTMTLLQQNLAAAEVRATLRPFPPPAYMGPVGPLRSGAFDVALYGLYYGREPDLVADWSCASRPPHGGNFARWCAPELERALQTGRTGAALRALYDQMPCIPLSHAYEHIGVARRVGHFALPGPYAPATYLCARWTVAT